MKSALIVAIMLLLVGIAAKLVDYYWLYPYERNIVLIPIADTSYTHGSRTVEVDKHPNVKITAAKLVKEAVDHAYYEVTYDLEAVDGADRYWIAAYRHNNGHSQPMSGHRPGRALLGRDNVTKVYLTLIDRSKDSSVSDSVRFQLYSIPHGLARHEQLFNNKKLWCKKRAAWWNILSQCADDAQG